MKHRGIYADRYRRLADESARLNACPICLKLIPPGVGQKTHGWGGSKPDGSYESVSMCWPHYRVVTAHRVLEWTGGYE